MRIGIIGGTGAEGRGVASRLARAGVPVLVGSRSIDRAREASERVRAGDGTLPVEPALNETVLAESDIVLLAVPFASASELVTVQAARLSRGAILVDLTVPLRFEGGVPALVRIPEGSAAEHLRARLPPEIQLAAALKTIPATLLGRVDAPLDCDEFVCGDSSESRAAVIDVLGRIAGLRLHDVGGLESARTLEGMSLLAVTLNKRYHVRTARYRVVGV
jgi:NADPH-dependent F420 reductase